ncbi:stealth conserved region 3 domain-containing protein [Candidatus Gracilibacteria bacterium]|nr:stealth conserved region 3 domain-containing protein [Candidatus Gracilibacteria bacterium]
MSKFTKFFKKPNIFWRDYFIKRYPFKNSQGSCHVKNLKDELCFNFLISKFKKENFSGMYYTPLDAGDKHTLCILQNNKETFFKQLYQYTEKEGFKLSIKSTNYEIRNPASPHSFRLNTVGKKCVEIRLSTTRQTGVNLNNFWFKVEFWKEEEDFYLAPTNNYNYISLKLWKSVAHQHGLFEDNSLKDYSSILKYPHESDVKFDIDLVFTWVNSEDPDWKKMYKENSPDIIDDASSGSRFLSRNELMYSLRSWSLYGNFIRNIYIVSNCKPPEWLNLNHKNIRWVYHEEIIPEKFLPTFSSHAIEASLHKIKGLSNHFIYCNDDVFLGRPAQPSDFYYSNGIAKIRLEAYGNVNGEIKEEHPDYLNAARNSNVLLEDTFQKTTTQLHTHSPSSLRVDVLTEMNNKFPTYFEETISNRFRSSNDINVPSFFAPHYALLSGKALQSDVKTELIQQGHSYTRKFQRLSQLKEEKNLGKLPLSFCINDGGDSHLNTDWNQRVITFLDEYFPEKSDFEIK